MTTTLDPALPSDGQWQTMPNAVAAVVTHAAAAMLMHAHFQGKVQNHPPVTLSHNGRSATFTIKEAVTGTSIVDVQPATPADAGTLTDISSWTLFGSSGIPSSAAINQRSISDCYYLAALGLLADWDPEYIQNIIQPVVDANNNLVPNLVDVYFTRSGTITRVRTAKVMGTAGDNSTEDVGCWGITAEAAYAFYRTGADTYASLNEGFFGSALLDLGVPLGSSQWTVATIWQQMVQGWMPGLSSGDNVPAGIPASHCEWALPISQQPEAANVAAGKAPQFIRFRNPWGATAGPLYFDLTDAFIAQYFPAGSVQFGLPPTIQIASVVPNAAPVAPVSPPLAPAVPQSPATASTTTPTAPIAGVTFTATSPVVGSNGNLAVDLYWNVPGAKQVELYSDNPAGIKRAAVSNPGSYIDAEQWEGPQFYLVITAADGSQTTSSLNPWGDPVTPAPVTPPTPTLTQLLAAYVADASQLAPLLTAIVTKIGG